VEFFLFIKILKENDFFVILTVENCKY